VKKIFGILGTRNENDIIESFFRYNLTYLDGILVFENNKSTDNTRSIIQNLINEGLPIYFTDYFEGDYQSNQYEIANAMAQIAVDEYGADLIVALDTDEFLYHIGGINPRETLEALHEDIEYQIPWRTYIYEKEPDIELGFMPNNFTHYRNPALEAAQGHAGTTIASKYLIQEKKSMFVVGAHWLQYPEEYKGSIQIRNPEKLVCAHFPIRSQTQVRRKAIPNWMGKWCKSNREPHSILDVFQLGQLFNELRDNGEITSDKMKQYSLEYSVRNGISNLTAEDLKKIERDLGDSLTVNGPMDVSFCADKLKLRYTNYKEDNKVFLRATLNQIDKTVMFLSSESDEKSKKILDDSIATARELNSLIEKCNSLTEEHNSLTEKCNSLTEKHISLTEKYNNLTERYNNLTVEKTDLAADRDNVITERDSLTEKCNSLTVEKTDLAADRDNLITERDSLLNSRSWRFTKPLRKAGVFIRRNKVLYLFAKGLLSLKRNGIKETLKKIKDYKRRNLAPLENNTFDPASCGVAAQSVETIGNAILNEQQKESAEMGMVSLIEKFTHKPLISVIMPLYNSPLKWLEIAVKSLQAQSYANWELCAVDDGSKTDGAKKLIKNMAKKDRRIRLFVRKKNGGISAASNNGLEMAKGEFIALMDHDDELPSDALFWMVNEINEHPDTDFIYSDECKIDCEKNEKYHFFCKPDWSPSMLLNYMYTGHFTVYRTLVVREIGGFRSEYDFSQDYDLALRMGDVAKNIRHVERVLYYWRAIPGSAAVEGGKDYARESNIAATKDWYKRNGMDAVVLPEHYSNVGIPNLPTGIKVSVIIPTDNLDNINKCVKSLVKNTLYPDYEIVVVTNSKTAELTLREFPNLDNLVMCNYDKPFNFSDKCNEGAYVASGNVLCFYNDDVFPISKDWMERMLEALILPGVGAVTPLLEDENGMVHSAGMHAGSPEPGFVHCTFIGQSAKQAPPKLISDYVLRDISISHGACSFISKDAFECIGGFDSVNTPNGHSDVDISFRLRENNYRCVYTPHAVMCHIGHGSWNAPKIKDKSVIYCLDRWGRQLSRDPYFTRNMSSLYFIHYSFAHKIFTPEISAKRKTSGRDILFVTHELSRTGAPTVLLAMVRVVLENGDWPVVVSMVDGPLKQEYLDIGVTVIVDESLNIPDRGWIFDYFARNFDLVVVNTLACGRVISALNDSLPPVLWWIHESPLAVKLLESIIPAKTGANVRMYACSDYSARALYKTGLTYKFESILYGVPNMPSATRIHGKCDKVTFITIGSLEYRKGQDVLLRAIESLKEKYTGKVKFVFIGGNYDENIYQKIINLAQKYDHIEYYEVMPQEELCEWYGKADCLILPSREEPMSIVAAESMLFSKPVISSDQTGIADFITHNKNGFIFPSEDYKKLAELIIFTIENRGKMAEMGHKARKEIYENHFTMEIFKENALNAIGNVIQSVKGR